MLEYHDQLSAPASGPSWIASDCHVTVEHGRLGHAFGPATEVSTAELRVLLDTCAVLLLDARPRLEWAISHLPGAVNVAPKPGVSMSEYVSDVREIERLTRGRRSVPLVLYCNGPYCGKTGRLARELHAAGFTSVRCYQLGTPMWRALGGVMVTEIEGARYILDRDRSATWVDARPDAARAPAGPPGAVRIARGEVTAAKDDGRLPMEDHNTRVVVYGSSPRQARTVAEEIVAHAFHNVTYFNGSLSSLARKVSSSGEGG